MDLCISAIILIVILALFFRSFERQKPRPRDIVPIAVMSAIGALGRVLFAAIPSFKPTSAVVIITGIQFGPLAGFLTGALSALASNMFLGQGPWTPWQMVAWGLIGFFAGMFQRKNWFRYRGVLYGFGMLSGILFGWLMNAWYLVGYVNPITWQAIVVSYSASAVMDVTHGLATVIFLFALEKPWGRKLHRLKIKYGIFDGRG
ncbi:MAG: ECF transporter S component [Hespellia sp.]|nr:ECF transporter S component [Hespellia sp.]